MSITVNGEERSAEEGTTIAAMLESLGLKADGVVVQQNGAIIERDAYAGTAIADGDTFEVVRIVGGG